MEINNSLKDKVIVVTGGTGVLGNSFVNGITEAGGIVGILGREEDVANKRAATINKNGGKAIGLKSDVLDEGELSAALKKVLQQFGKIDGLQFPEAKTFAYTFRLQQEYWAVLKQGPETVVSKQFPIDDVIDKAGSGDCFMAGLLYGLYKNHTSQQVVNYAAAAAVGKLQEKGDATNQTVEMIILNCSEE